MAGKKIQATKNYRMFTRSEDNRDTDMKKHKRLLDSMKQYGFIPAFPIVCHIAADGRRIVKDGQHRLMVAESLGLPVFFVDETIDFNIATINGTARTWTLADYARMFSKKGLADYQGGLEFAETNKLPIGTAFALLAGTTTYSNVQSEFLSGRFKIKDRQWAEAVAGIYVPLVELSSDVRNARFLEACMAVCRVEGFSADRLLQSARRCRDKLVAYSTRDAYLDMLQEIYNFGRHKICDLRVAATVAMRERNAVVAKKRKAAERRAARGATA